MKSAMSAAFKNNWSIVDAKGSISEVEMGIIYNGIKEIGFSSKRNQ